MISCTVWAIERGQERERRMERGVGGGGAGGEVGVVF